MSEILPYLIGQSAGGSGAVSSVFGRTGAVSAQSGDYSSTDVTNASSVTGATATAALDKLKTDLAAVGAGISDWKQSVKTRTDTPPGSPADGDRYLAGASPTGAWAGHANAIVDRTSGAWVFTAPTAGDAVNTEDTGHAWVYSGTTTSWNDMGATTVAPVLSVYGRTGTITAQSGDYTATQITLTPTGDVAASTVQAGIAELASEKAVVARQVIAGDGLTGGGDLSADRTFAVGAGTGIAVNADDVALANMAQATLKGRAAGAGTGAPADLTATQVRTILNVADGATAAGAAGDAYATSHEADTTAHAASSIVNTPAGGIAATTVQAALNELDAEKVSTARAITAGSGLSGGGDLSADRSIAVSFSGSGSAATVARSDHNHDTTYAARATQIATQYSLTGGGDLSATRTLSLVNDAATPGVNKVYGTDAAGTRGWQNAGGAGQSSYGGGGVLSVSNATTTLTSLKAGGQDIAAGTFDAVGSKVTYQIEGNVTNNSGSNKTFSFQVKTNGTISQLSGSVNSISTAAVGSRASPLQRGLNLTLELWRTDANSIGGSLTVIIEGISPIVTALVGVTGLNFASTINIDVLAAVSATGTSVSVNSTAWSLDRVGTVAGTGAAALQFSTIAALKAAPSAPAGGSGTLCDVLGYSAAADGGGGQFVWQATSISASDDGNTVRPGFVASDADPGRWRRLQSSMSSRRVYNLADFGFNLDGGDVAGNDTRWAALLTILDDGGSYAGGIVEIPAGANIAYTQPIQLRCNTIIRGLGGQGFGNASVLAPQGCAALVIDGSTKGSGGWAFFNGAENLMILPGGAGVTGSLIYLKDQYSNVFRDIRLHNAGTAPTVAAITHASGNNTLLEKIVVYGPGNDTGTSYLHVTGGATLRSCDFEAHDVGIEWRGGLLDVYGHYGERSRFPLLINNGATTQSEDSGSLNIFGGIVAGAGVSPCVKVIQNIQPVNFFGVTLYEFMGYGFLLDNASTVYRNIKCYGMRRSYIHDDESGSRVQHGVEFIGAVDDAGPENIDYRWTRSIPDNTATPVGDMAGVGGGGYFSGEIVLSTVQGGGLCVLEQRLPVVIHSGDGSPSLLAGTKVTTYYSGSGNWAIDNNAASDLLTAEIQSGRVQFGCKIDWGGLMSGAAHDVHFTLRGTRWEGKPLFFRTL